MTLFPLLIISSHPPEAAPACDESFHLLFWMVGTGFSEPSALCRGFKRASDGNSKTSNITFSPRLEKIITEASAALFTCGPRTRLCVSLSLSFEYDLHNREQDPISDGGGWGGGGGLFVEGKLKMQDGYRTRLHSGTDHC